MKKTASIFFISIFIIALCSCQNNDTVFLKELKQQNAFLEEQLSYSEQLLAIQQQSNLFAKPYADLFFKNYSLAFLYLKSLENSPKDLINTNYTLFLKQSNRYFDSASRVNPTKFAYDDIILLSSKVDSSLFLIKNDSIKRELVKQQILQHYLTISQLCRGASSVSGLRFNNPNCYGFRLTIEKNKTETVLNLQCFDPQRMPHFEKLEFVSLSKNNKGDYYNHDELTDIKSQIIEYKYDKDAIIIKSKFLTKGFYRIYCKKLSILNNGRFMKQATEFDFEIN